MNLLTLHHGLYGQRIADNLRLRSPENWQISELELPKALPLIVDEPEEFLPLELPSANLVLHLAETSQAAQLLPGVIRLSGAFVVITPIDNDTWIPPGMRRQLGRELTALGAAIVFFEPFCALAEDLIAAQPDLQPEQQDVLMAFTRHFGRPRLRVIMSDDETISDVIVERGAACGSGFRLLILLTVIGYLGNIKRRGKRIGVTTEVAAMLTFLFGWYSFLSRSTGLH